MPAVNCSHDCSYALFLDSSNHFFLLVVSANVVVHAKGIRTVLSTEIPGLWDNGKMTKGFSGN